MNETAKKNIWQKPMPYIILLIAIVLVSAFFLYNNHLHSNTQRLNLAGYAVDVPAEWSIRLENEVAVFYANPESEEPLGKARLINQQTAEEDFGKWFYFETQPTKTKQHDNAICPLSEQHYTEGDFQYGLYVFSSLPNPQPYHFAIYFEENSVKPKTVRRILKSFFIPDAGKNPPPKNLEAPTEEEIAETAVYKIIAEEQTRVRNTSLLEDFMAALKTENQTQTALSILSYTNQNGVLALDSWMHLDFDGEKILLYQYYQTDNGTYSYNNNPKQILSIQQTKNEEQNTTVFQGTLANNEICLLFEYPVNPYEEEKDTLYAMGSTSVGDNSTVSAIIDALPTPGLVRDTFSLQTDKEPYGITIEYSVSDYETAFSDGKLNHAPFEKNAAVIFSLVDNVDNITINVTYENQKETFRYTREKTDRFFETDVRNYAKEPKEFRRYVEDVQNMPPSDSKQEESSATSGVVGEVVYSTTVTIPHGMLVTHPRTGQKVVVDPYAERYGYAQYLGKPISCVIYRTGSGYRLIASCNGTVLTEYSMANDSDKAYVISMLQAYGG